MNQFGKYIFIIGAVVMVAGLLIWLFGNKLNWFGNLPGDIKVEKENFRLYIPLTTMLLVSIVLTILLWIIRKFSG